MNILEYLYKKYEHKPLLKIRDENIVGIQYTVYLQKINNNLYQFEIKTNHPKSMVSVSYVIYRIRRHLIDYFSIKTGLFDYYELNNNLYVHGKLYESKGIII